MKKATLDPLSVNERLYRQIDRLLQDIEASEELTIRERIAALIAVGRIQVIFMGLRKENKDDPNAGSQVRKYAGAFSTANADRRGKKTARSGAAADDDDDAIIRDAIGDDSFADDDDAA